MKKLLIGLLVTAMLFSLSQVVLAENGANKESLEQVGRNIPIEELPEDERKLLLERMEVVEKFIWEIEKAHATLRSIENKLSNESDENSISKLTQSITNAEVALDKARKNVAPYGLELLEPIDKEEKVDIQSIAGDFTITENVVYYDSVLGKYLHHTAGNWITENWKNDVSCGVCFAGWKDVGGTNGYYLASLHEPINTYLPQFQTLYYSDYTQYIDWSNTASAYSSSNGFGWEFQDQGRLQGITLLTATDYNAHRQIGWYYFDFVNGVPKNKSVSFKVDVGHSWASTAINGIGIGPYSFSFSWSSDNNKWNKASTVSYSF